MPLNTASRRPLLGAALLLLAGAAPALPGSTPVAAAVPLLSCPAGLQTVTYTPGLHLPPAPPATAPTVALVANGTLGPCVSADLRHTGASVVVNGSGQLSCLDGNSTGIGRVTWADPATVPSEYVYTGGVSLRPDGTNVLVLTGTVTAGDYTGASVLSTIAVTGPDPTACLSADGLRTVAGEFTLTFTP